MGATNFIETISSTKGVNSAFNMLVGEYEMEYGDRDYNGTISTCSLGSCKLRFDKYSKTNLDKAKRYILENNYGEKWRADYIDLGVIGYLVTTVKKENLKNKPKYKLAYVIQKEEGFEFVSTKYHYNTKTDADKKALALTLESGVRHALSKEYVLTENTKSNCSRFQIETKSYKSKPKLKPSDSRKIMPIHKYIFFGWASC